MVSTTISTLNLMIYQILYFLQQNTNLKNLEHDLWLKRKRQTTLEKKITFTSFLKIQYLIACLLSLKHNPLKRNFIEKIQQYDLKPLQNQNLHYSSKISSGNSAMWLGKDLINR